MLGKGKSVYRLNTVLRIWRLMQWQVDCFCFGFSKQVISIYFAALTARAVWWNVEKQRWRRLDEWMRSDWKMKAALRQIFEYRMGRRRRRQKINSIGTIQYPTMSEVEDPFTSWIVITSMISRPLTSYLNNYLRSSFVVNRWCEWHINLQ